MKEKRNIYIFSFLAVFFWAIGFPFTKLAMQHFTPNALGFARISVGTITLLLIGIKAGNRLPKVKDIPIFLITGACGFTFYLLVFNRGLLTVTSATSSIVMALIPVLTAIWASVIYGEKLTEIGKISMFTAFVGVCVIMFQKGIKLNIGVLWTLIGTFLFSVYNILNRKISYMGYRAIEIVTYSMMSSVIELSIFSPQAIVQLKTANLTDILVLITLGVLSSASAYYLWGKALSIAKNTSDVTNFGFVTPLLTTIIGIVVLDEIPNVLTLVGGVIIIGSVITFAKKGKIVN